MVDIEDPDHPGWAIWERVRQEHRASWEFARDLDERAGRPGPPPYRPRPEIPPPGHLDLLVRNDQKRRETARTFTYWEVRWDGRDARVIAERNAFGKLNGAVTFDGFLSGQWIFDPKVLEDIQHYEDMENHYTTRQVGRAEAERITAERRLVLPTEERLLEICEQRIGAMFGVSATPEELAERKKLMP